MSTLRQREKLVFSDVDGFMNDFIGEGRWKNFAGIYWSTTSFVIVYHVADGKLEYATFVIRLWDEYEASKLTPKKQESVMSLSNMDTIAWTPQTKIFINGNCDTYRTLVNKWFELASSDEFYSNFINDRYGSYKGFVEEIEKSRNWLLINADKRKKHLNAFLTGWLDRWSSRFK